MFPQKLGVCRSLWDLEEGHGSFLLQKKYAKFAYHFKSFRGPVKSWNLGQESWFRIIILTSINTKIELTLMGREEAKLFWKNKICVGLCDLRQTADLFCNVASLFLCQPRFIVKFNKIMSNHCFQFPRGICPVPFFFFFFLIKCWNVEVGEMDRIRNQPSDGIRGKCFR